MRKVSLRSLWGHKRRLVSTVVSIVLGVSFMSGTTVFADTLDRVFDNLFADVNDKVDSRVQSSVTFSTFDGGDQRDRFDEGVLDAVAGVDGVAVAAPVTATIGFGPSNRVLGSDGDPVGASQGPPTLIETWVDDERISPYELTDGSRGPEADNEIALNVGAADDGEYEVGDEVIVVTQFGNLPYELVGTFTFAGGQESAAGAVSAEFTLPEAQRLAGADGLLDSIMVAAEDGVSQDDLTARIAEVLPTDVEAITGEAAAAEDADSVQEGFAFFQQALSIFGTIALLVGTFIIANTFQILVAQRTKELALLRAVGASRRQVLTSVLLEAVAIGLVAGGLGVLGGIGLAKGISSLLDASGADLPSGGLLVSPAMVINGILIGLVVTVVAAIAPAIRATRVPPLAALREVAFERTGASKPRIAVGILLVLFAVLNVSKAWTSDGDTDAVPTVGLGALLLIFGAITVGPLLAGPTVRALGGALPRFRGITGRLAVENAARSPKRTSATASALLIGVALIGFITVFAASAKASVDEQVGQGLQSDMVIQPSGGFFGGFGGFSPAVAEDVAQVDGVGLVAEFAGTGARATYPDGDDANTFLGAIEPETFGQVARPVMAEGEITDLAPGQVIVDESTAEDNALEIGSTVSFQFPGGGGESIELVVSAISDDLVVLTGWTMHIDDYRAIAPEPLDFQLFVDAAEGASIPDVLAAVDTAIEQYPGIKVLDQEGFKSDLASQLTAFVNVIYGLLFLSIIIAMIGVANTLSLSVYERTRELGLLRAVGMERGQVRSAIRWEAVIISLLGVSIGLVLGLIGSYAMVKALSGFGLETFVLPVGGLIVWIVLFLLFGLVASPPAHRASKLDILKAIAHS